MQEGYTALNRPRTPILLHHLADISYTLRIQAHLSLRLYPYLGLEIGDKGLAQALALPARKQQYPHSPGEISSTQCRRHWRHATCNASCANLSSTAQTSGI